MEVKKPKVSDQEKKWVRMLADGKTTSEVAGSVGLPAGTFAYKLNLLRARLGCDNMASLVAFFYKNKLIE